MSENHDFIDLTPVWDRCHPHLRPLRAHLPLAVEDHVTLPDGGRGVAVLAHLRFGESTWTEVPAPVIYDPQADRFLLQRKERSDPPQAAVTAVNARLWFSAPTFLNIEPTTRCNFNCWYCVGRQMKQEDIRTEDFATALDHFPALKTLALVGEGEPLMHKGFFEMAAQARARGIRVMIISNGSTLSESNVRKLCENEIAYVGISIDSYDAATFSQSRIDGKLEQVWRGIERLRRYRDEHGFRYPQIGLKGTLFEDTKNQLPAIIETAKQHGVEIFEGFQPLNPMSSYVRVYPPEHLKELDRIPEVTAVISRDAAAQQSLLRLDEFCAREGIDIAKNGLPNRLRKNCDEQWIYALLSGDVTPCCQIKTPLDSQWNLFHNSIDQILADPHYENTRFNLWNGLFPVYCEGCWKIR